MAIMKKPVRTHHTDDQWRQVQKKYADAQVGGADAFKHFQNQQTDIDAQREKMRKEQEKIALEKATGREAIKTDIDEGMNYGKKILGDGLGRMQGDAEVDEIGSRLKDLSQGFSSEELTARREQSLSRVQDSGQASQRALQAALARAGVKGGAAGAKLTDLAMEGVQQRGNIERDLFIADADRRSSGLNNYAKFTTGVREFDLGQLAKEKNIVSQSGLAFGQLGSAERSANKQADSAAAAAAAQSRSACFPAGTMIEMADGTEKAIEDIEPGENVAVGGEVYIVGHGKGSPLYDYLNVLVTGSHAVCEDGVFVAVEDSQEAIPTDLHPSTVYNLYCENHMMIIQGTLFGDFSDVESINKWMAHGTQKVA